MVVAFVDSNNNLPVPPSQIKFLGATVLVTTTDEVYVDQANCFGGSGWFSVGPPPGSTSIEDKTWGSIKDSFKGDDSQ